MGASAREIERQISETRERMDVNLRQLEARVVSDAVRYGSYAAVAIGVLALGGIAVAVYVKARRPTP